MLQGIASIENDRDGVGQHVALPDDGPAYLFWIRDARGNLAAIAAVVCSAMRGNDLLPFSYVRDQLQPALELLRRDLLARADIAVLNESLSSRDKLSSGTCTAVSSSSLCASGNAQRAPLSLLSKRQSASAARWRRGSG